MPTIVLNLIGDKNQALNEIKSKIGGLGVWMTGDSLQGTLEGGMRGKWTIVRNKIYLKFDLIRNSDLDALASVTKKLEELFDN